MKNEELLKKLITEWRAIPTIEDGFGHSMEGHRARRKFLARQSREVREEAKCNKYSLGNLKKLLQTMWLCGYDTTVFMIEVQENKYPSKVLKDIWIRRVDALIKNI